MIFPDTTGSRTGRVEVDEGIHSFSLFPARRFSHNRKKPSADVVDKFKIVLDTYQAPQNIRQGKIPL